MMPSYVQFDSLSFCTVDCVLVTDRPAGSSFVPQVRWQAGKEMRICNRPVFTCLSDTPTHCWGFLVPGSWGRLETALWQMSGHGLSARTNPPCRHITA